MDDDKKRNDTGDKTRPVTVNRGKRKVPGEKNNERATQNIIGHVNVWIFLNIHTPLSLLLHTHSMQAENT